MLKKLLRAVAYQENDEAQVALSAIYDNFGSKIAGAAFKVLKNKEQCEEILNDVMVNIWENAKKYSALSNPLGYITTIAYNRAIDISRLTKEYPEMNIEAFADMKNSKSADYTLNIDVADALKKIDETERTIIILKSVYEYSFREIAKILKLEYHDTRRKYEKAKESLKVLLKNTY